jgi:hypothetical protein
LPHVTLTGDLTGEYVVSDHRDDGTLVLVPESDVSAGLRANGLRAATPSGADAWFAEHADVMLPPDGEG